MIGIAVVTLRPGRMGGSETYVRGLLRALREHGELDYRELVRGDARLDGLDAIHYPFTIAYPRTKLPAAVTVHDVLHREALRSPRSLVRRLTYDRSSRRADAILVPSEFVRGRVHELLGIPEERIRVVHHGIDHDRFRPGEESREGFLFYPAEPWPHKNQCMSMERRGDSTAPRRPLLNKTYLLSLSLISRSCGGRSAWRSCPPPVRTAPRAPEPEQRRHVRRATCWPESPEPSCEESDDESQAHELQHAGLLEEHAWRDAHVPDGGLRGRGGIGSLARCGCLCSFLLASRFLARYGSCGSRGRTDELVIVRQQIRGVVVQIERGRWCGSGSRERPQRYRQQHHCVPSRLRRHWRCPPRLRGQRRQIRRPPQDRPAPQRAATDRSWTTPVRCRRCSQRTRRKATATARQGRTNSCSTTATMRQNGSCGEPWRGNGKRGRRNCWRA